MLISLPTPGYQGDRLLEVNHHNVEQEEHEAVVELVKESGDMVTLNVQSIKQEQIVKLSATQALLPLSSSQKCQKLDVEMSENFQNTKISEKKSEF